MNIIKYKNTLYNLLPEIIFNLLIYIWRNTYVKFNEFSRSLKIKNFDKPFFKKIIISNSNDFFLKISPSNWYVDQTIYIDGIYEKDIYSLMKKVIKPGDTCIDIGANIWMYTNFFPKISWKNWKTIAFEPVISNFLQNMESIKKNNYSNVKLYNYALSDIESEIDIFITDNNLWWSSINKNCLHTRKEKIKTYTGDSILMKEKNINFIKIDTEWSELKVLKWLSGTLKKFWPQLIIEYSPVLLKSKREADEILTLLSNLYWYVYIIELEKTLNLKNISDKKEYYKLSLTEQVNLHLYN